MPEGRKPTRAAGFLRRGGTHLDRLLAEAAARERLCARVRAAVGSPAAEHVRACGLNRGLLQITTDSSVWAARLRYQVPRILGELRSVEGLEDLRSVRIRVAVSRGEPLHPPLAPPAMSAEAGAMLKQVSESTADPSLRSILRRLSGRAHGGA